MDSCRETHVHFFRAMGFPGGISGKEPTCQCRRQERCRFNPWVWKIPGDGHGNPLQCSCLENPMERGAVGLQSMGSQRVRHDRVHTHTHTHTHTQLDAHFPSAPIKQQQKMYKGQMNTMIEITCCLAFENWELLQN